MEIRPDILTIIITSALVTAIPRALPMILLSRIELPSWLRDWLAAVPVAILSALLALEMLAGGADAFAGDGTYRLMAIVVVAILTLGSRSPILAITSGMVSLALLRLI
jgi:branched-subunit amino acid transport protein